MEQFKKAKVVLLPTKNKIGKKGAPLNLLLSGKLELSNTNGTTYNPKPQHLYIISDDEIKDGDWYSSPNGIVSQYNGKEVLPKGWWKIIASYPPLEDSMFLGCIQPQPSQQFIEQYIESYNKGEVITDILVEYETKCIDCGAYPVNNNSICTHPILHNHTRALANFIKINPKDNTITIKKVKDIWNREEARGLLIKLHDEFPDRSELNQWLIKNL